MIEFMSMLIKYFKELIKDKALMKKCITLAIPIMFQNFVVSAVTLVDNLMVGVLGDTAISAVASANKYYTIIFFIVSSVVAACLIFMAQYNGANNYEKMKETFRFSLISSYVPLIIVFIIVTLFPSQLIGFLIDDKAIIIEGTKYIKLAAYSYLPLGISISIAGAMRSVGDSKTPMFISIISIIVNAFLDYGLILGKFGLPMLGVEGAAIATIIARIVEAILLLRSVKKGDYVFDSRIKELFKFDKVLAKEIIIKALPLVLNELLFQLGMAMQLKAVSTRGAIANTAYSIAITVSDLFFVLFGGMAIATTVLVGTPLGANKLQEAKDNGYKLIVFSVILAFFFGVAMFVSQFAIPLIYPSISKDALSMAQLFLRIMSLLFWIYMFDCQCYFTLRAGGDTKATLYMDSGFMWLINLPVLFCLSSFTNLPATVIYVCGQLTDVIKAFFAFYMVKKERWVKNLAIDNK